MTSLSRRLHLATRQVHARAERSTYMVGLVRGTLGPSHWALLLGQLRPIYAELEAREAELGSHPVVRPFLHPQLARTVAIDASLEALAAPPEYAPLRATRRYVEAIGSATPAQFVMHHWVRYLGDLSGGQALRVMLTRSMGLTPAQVQFYDFGDLSPKHFKDHYHHLLDALVWNADELCEYAITAFEHTIDVFDELAEVDAGRGLRAIA